MCPVKSVNFAPLSTIDALKYMSQSIHAHFMKEALKQAAIALEKGEVPVGAVVVWKNRIIGRAYNQTEMLHDPTAHAEMIAMTQASETLAEGKKDHRGSLEGASLYVTLEPCAMCAGALVLTKCKNLIFGALDAKAGACKSLYRITQDDRLNHRLNVTGGILEQDAKFLLQEFFKTLRKERR
jgi:tRNA(adenine34) deaminase